MASFGMALVDGQKNAQALAAGQLGTMNSMAQSAKNASQIEDYFGPEATAMRDVDKEDTALKANKIKVFNQMAPGVFADPTKAGQLLEATTPTSGKWDVAPVASDPSKYVAREILTDASGNQTLGREKIYSSKQELLSTIGQEFIQTPREAMAAAQGLYAKQLEHQEKRADKTHEGLVKYETEIKPTLGSLETRTKWNNATDRFVSDNTGQWGFRRAQEGNALPAEKYALTAKERANVDMGVREDKEGNLYIPQFDSTGKATGEMPLSSAPKETQDKYWNHRRQVSMSQLDGLREGSGPLSGGLKAMDAQKEVERRLEAERVRSGIDLSKPTASSPDMAARQAAERGKPTSGGIPKSQSLWSTPDLGGKIAAQGWKYSGISPNYPGAPE